MKGLIAQNEEPIGPPISGGNVAIGEGGDPVNTLASLLSTIIGLLTVIAALYFMFMLVSLI